MKRFQPYLGVLVAIGLTALGAFALGLVLPVDIALPLAAVGGGVVGGLLASR